MREVSPAAALIVGELIEATNRDSVVHSPYLLAATRQLLLTLAVPAVAGGLLASPPASRRDGGLRRVLRRGGMLVGGCSAAVSPAVWQLCHPHWHGMVDPVDGLVGL